VDQEKAIQFLLENMASLSAGLIGLQQQHAHLASAVERVAQIQERVVQIQEGFGETLTALVEHGQRTEDRFDRLIGIVERLGNSVEQLAQAQQHTEERLNVLIKIVNGLVRGPLR
jgi:DNA repair ATPase RecN